MPKPQLAEDRAIREVIARCLYGADINPMAVEMCKLSLWLVSLDPTKPFSFVDDKIFCGNSLLGLTTLDQLRHMHIDPDTKRKYLQPYVDVDAVLQEATRLRKELASPVDEDDPQRSTAGQAAATQAVGRGHREAPAHRRRHHRRRADPGWQTRPSTRRYLQVARMDAVRRVSGKRGGWEPDSIGLKT